MRQLPRCYLFSPCSRAYLGNDSSLQNVILPLLPVSTKELPGCSQSGDQERDKKRLSSPPPHVTMVRTYRLKWKPTDDWHRSSKGQRHQLLSQRSCWYCGSLSTAYEENKIKYDFLTFSVLYIYVFFVCSSKNVKLLWPFQIVLAKVLAFSSLFTHSAQMEQHLHWLGVMLSCPSVIYLCLAFAMPAENGLALHAPA